MTDEVRRWCDKENLIQTGDHIMVGVSGGADSVCLLLVLLELQKCMEFTLEAVHVEHGIRGEESRKDARFAEELCKRLGVACQVYYVDVPEYAAANCIGMEEAARILRYDCYKKAAEQSQRSQIKIALAHHADDNAETVLFQMARGSGIRGMCGIPSKRQLTEQIVIIRPLLGVTRSEIEAYLKEQGQDFCIDSTNLDTEYSRNRIRHGVLPELKKVNAKAVAHIAQSAGMLVELSDYLDGEVTRIAAKCCEKSGKGIRIDHALFEQYPPILQKEVIHQVLGEVAGSRKDIGSIHVEAVISLRELQVGRRISLPYQMMAERIYEGVRIFLMDEKVEGESVEETFEINEEQLEEAKMEAGVRIPVRNGELRLRIFDFDGKMGGIQKKAYTKWLNYDKIKGGLLFRKRAGGDYLTIDSAGHKKKLKEYFIEEKIPREQREHTWLLTEGAHVLWVVGGRISADYKIDINTKRVLEVQIVGGNYYED